ncbi:MAG: protein kinase [Vicinamibacterales bacterium]|nr:protein kinase [Vicinamibacterales bacterium]
MSTTQPSSIGRYEIIGRLGEGGMGAVYLARDPLIDRQIAVKFLREGLENDELRERFVREARSAGRLQHVNIVVIFDVGEQGGRPYIAMEYVEGSTLADTVRRRDAMPLLQKLRLLEQLSEGLAYAHRAGIVHRDIKPANLIVSRDGVLKILDFGIARLGRANLTMAGVMLGTLNYMSPEQITGGDIDKRSDIFAVGSVCYEFLSNARAFPGDLQDGILHRIITSQPPPLSGLCPGLDPRIIEIVNRALEKDPARRYQDLESLQADLTVVREALTPPTTPGAVRTSAAVVPAEPPTLHLPTSPGTVQRTMTGREQATRFRGEQIGQWLETARGALERGEHDEALQACQQVFVLDPDNAAAHDLAEQANRCAAEQQIVEHVTYASELLSSGALEDASRVLKLALALDPASPAALRTRQAIDEARRIRDQEAEQLRAINSAMDDAEAAYSAGSFDTALRKLDDVLSLDRTHEGARTLRDDVLDAIDQDRRVRDVEEKARATVAEAWAWYDRGDDAAAIAVLEGAAIDHPLIASALAELRRLQGAAQQMAEGGPVSDSEKTIVVAPMRPGPATEPLDLDSTVLVQPLTLKPDRPATGGHTPATGSRRTGSYQTARMPMTGSGPRTQPTTARRVTTSPDVPSTPPSPQPEAPPVPGANARPLGAMAALVGANRRMLAAVAAVILVVAAGTIVFWPSGPAEKPATLEGAAQTPAPAPAASVAAAPADAAPPGTPLAGASEAATPPALPSPNVPPAAASGPPVAGAVPATGSGAPSRRRRTPETAPAPVVLPQDPPPTAPVAPPPPPPRGTLVVESDTPGASVYMDDQLLGQAPIRTSALEAGSYRLRATLEGEDDITRVVDLGTSGETTVFLRFKEVRLRVAIPVVHKHGGGGSCEGRLSASLAGLTYDTPNRNDAFSMTFDELERFQMDLPSKTLTVKKRGGRTWNFTDRNASPETLAQFHARVVKAREKLAAQGR